MPLAGILKILEPFLRGAARHPNSKEALFQKGSRIFNTATSYNSISLDHLANHLIYLSSSFSFWFSLITSYNDNFHLYKLFSMTPKDYEYLLVAANLAHFYKRWGFSIKMMKWNLFLEGHWYTTFNCDGTFEVDVALPLLVLLLCHPVVLSSRQLVVALPLLSLLLHHTLVLLFCAGWLLCHLSKRRPFVVSSCHPLVILLCELIVKSCLVILLLRRPLVLSSRRLVV